MKARSLTGKIAAIALRIARDDGVKLIESTPCGYAEKIELVGRHLFGELWEARFIPTSPEIPAYPENFNPQSSLPQPKST